MHGWRWTGRDVKGDIAFDSMKGVRKCKGGDGGRFPLNFCCPLRISLLYSFNYYHTLSLSKHFLTNWWIGFPLCNTIRHASSSFMPVAFESSFPFWFAQLMVKVCLGNIVWEARSICVDPSWQLYNLSRLSLGPHTSSCGSTRSPRTVGGSWKSWSRGRHNLKRFT